MSTLLSLLVICINIYTVITTVNGFELHWFALTVISILGVCYILFCIYLVLHMTISMGGTWPLKYQFVRDYIAEPSIDVSLGVHPISYSR